MQELLVLGLVPGTDIQITFTMWLAAGYTLILLFGIIYIMRSSFVRELLITLVVVHRLRRLQNLR